MEDEVSSSSSLSASSSTEENLCESMEEKENHAVGKDYQLSTTAGGTGREEPARKPFRKVSSSSSSSGSRKKPLQAQKSSLGIKHIKCVLIGDSKTGKSALVQSFLTGQSLSSDYVPTTQDEHEYTCSNVCVSSLSCHNKVDQENVGKKKNEIMLHVCDTGGQEEMDRLRPLCYDQAQMVIICFSVMNPTSFTNVAMKWLPEVKRHCMVTEDPNNPLKLLLVGTQSDLRSNVNMLLKLMDDGQAPISETQALRLASKIGALKYVESSSVTRSNVNHIFQLAMKYGEGKAIPMQMTGFDMDRGLQRKFLPNITERKLLFWRRWRLRQNKSSKMKRLVLLPCLF